MKKVLITKWGMRVLALVVWLVFSYITCLAIIDLWMSNPEWTAWALAPISSVIALGFEKTRALIMREIKHEYAVASTEPEHDKPWEPVAWKAGERKPVGEVTA